MRARATAAAPLEVTDLPAVERSAARGPAVVAEADCTIWIPEGWVRRCRAALGARVLHASRMNAAALQVLISRLTGVAEEMGAVLRRAAFSPNIKERADCSAALFTADGELLVQAEHIPVHLGSMPASVRAAIDACGARLRARRPGDPQRPVRRRHAPQRHHARRAVLRRRRHACSGWVANRAHHADLGGHGAGLDAARRHRDLPGGAAHPARRAARPRCEAIVRRRVAHARRAAGRPRRAASAPTGSASTRLRRARPPRRSPRSSTTASGGCGPRSPRCPTDAGEFEDVARLAPGPRLRAAAAGADRGRRSRSTATRSRSTSPAPTRSGAGNVNAVEAVTVSAVAFALRVASPTRRSRRTAARCGRCTWSRPRARSSPRYRRSRSAPATSR